MNAFALSRPWLHDPTVLKLPWTPLIPETRESNLGQKQLCLGYMFHDNIVMPHPPVIRAMRMVIQALEAVGHKVES